MHSKLNVYLFKITILYKCTEYIAGMILFYCTIWPKIEQVTCNSELNDAVQFCCTRKLYNLKKYMYTFVVEALVSLMKFKILRIILNSVTLNF